MGPNNKEKVRFVISHFEGCSGNFLGYLAANQTPKNGSFFRIDTNVNNLVLSVNGRSSWSDEIEQRFDSHTVVVTHNFDCNLIAHDFPNAKIVQIYPYTRVGNVLYNICTKKLNVKIFNSVDNHLINIKEWYQRLLAAKPQQTCHDFAGVRDRHTVEHMLDIQMTDDQEQFFYRYWNSQLNYDLNLPPRAMSIIQLLDLWNLHDFCNDWSMAWVIFTFEQCNNLQEKNRLWSIDNSYLLQDWKRLTMIENLYKATA